MRPSLLTGQSSSPHSGSICHKGGTNRAAAKRFKCTGSGKFVRARANKSHILTKKPSKRTRRLRQSTLVHSTNENALRRMLPYL
jgi:large subunit ribosomal protein L35